MSANRPGPARITPQEFVTKWRQVTQSERATAQSHFIDLCYLLHQPAPTDADPTGRDYAFEKGAIKSGGGRTGRQGWADVWKRGCFAWEYKKQHANLVKAYDQLQLYRESLENPPLLVVSDMQVIEVHTNFTNTVKQVYKFTLDDLLDHKKLEQLGRVFTDPDSFKKQTTTTAELTVQAATEFAKLSDILRRKGVAAAPASHFLIRLLFCLFAEDVGLLPDNIFSKLVQRTQRLPHNVFADQLRQLFAAMRTGGIFALENIPQFNGGLFDSDEVLELTNEGMEILLKVSKLNWSAVEPAIFGTLFERSLDPTKRSQLGAHYTSREDILLIVEPVLMQPLRQRWQEVQSKAEELATKRDGATNNSVRTRFENELASLVLGFFDEVAAVRVLDPACGSGNFLYVALKELLDLQKEIIRFAGDKGLTRPFPTVSPLQLKGIELNEYAHELAQATIWIGYIQWLRDNGFGQPAEPILKPLDNIAIQDAILTYNSEGKPVEPEWAEADVIIGNPPFLGGNRIRQGLGDQYVDNLFRLYDGRVPAFADLVCYWFERARSLIEHGKVKRAGLLSTNSIRGGVNRKVLEHIKETGDIFMAWSDRPWVLNGAAVRVSMIGFDSGTQKENRTLNGLPIVEINADLTGTINLTTSQRLAENAKLCFIGTKKAGSFDIEPSFAKQLLQAPLNPNGRPNGDVVFPWLNGEMIVKRAKPRWIIYFADLREDAASLYEQPFEYVKKEIYLLRQKNNEARARIYWWKHRRPAVEMREATSKLSRFIATPRVSKHRIFVWVSSETLPDDGIYVFARSDDYFFGVLHSKLHEIWSLKMCTWLGVGNDPRYTPTTCFETFPFPWLPGKEPSEHENTKLAAIAQASRELVQYRDNWLNPSGASEADLKKRTLTNLYNERPTWLANAHQKLDRAVFAAYDWPSNLSDDEILERLLALNLQRAAGQDKVILTTVISDGALEEINNS